MLLRTGEVVSLAPFGDNILIRAEGIFEGPFILKLDDKLSWRQVLQRAVWAGGNCNPPTPDRGWLAHRQATRIDGHFATGVCSTIPLP